MTTWGPHVHRARRALGSPRGVWLSLRMLGMAALLPLLTSRVPLGRLVAWAWVDPRPDRVRDPGRERQVARLSLMAHRAVTLGRRDNCLQRSLVAYRHLAAAHADPQLVIGARSGEHGVEGHVWVLVDGAPVHDTALEIATYAPVSAFGPAGLPLPVG